MIVGECEFLEEVREGGWRAFLNVEEEGVVIVLKAICCQNHILVLTFVLLFIH